MAIYSAEFYMKLYVDPIDFWKDGYNLLDLTIIIVISIPYALRKIKGKHYPHLKIANGMQSLRILKLITYSRGIRVSDWECVVPGVQVTGSSCPPAPDEIIIVLLSSSY